MSSPVLASLSAADRLPRSWLFIMKPTTCLSVFPSQPVFRIVYIIGISRLMLKSQLGSFLVSPRTSSRSGHDRPFSCECKVQRRDIHQRRAFMMLYR
jgi:hypothetical protein